MAETVTKVCTLTAHGSLEYVFQVVKPAIAKFQEALAAAGVSVEVEEILLVDRDREGLIADP